MRMMALFALQVTSKMSRTQEFTSPSLLPMTSSQNTTSTRSVPVAIDKEFTRIRASCSWNPNFKTRI
eukprot:scaffold2640_cov180-Amphora_coffeaeformis.AAC.14